MGEAAEHGMLSMRFTEEGSLSYEPAPLAEDRAETALKGLGWGRLPRP
jgi:hypothetical protein